MTSSKAWLTPWQADMHALDRLQLAENALPSILRAITESESEIRPAPDRWTKKEIIGHLIDSASNNHQRFVRAQIESGLDLPGYQQEKWVQVQNYNTARWSDLVDLWAAYNSHILHIARTMNGAATCTVNGGNLLTLNELFIDYVDHLEHHLQKLLGTWPPK